MSKYLTIRFFEKGINSSYIDLKVKKSFINNKEKISMMYHFPETEKMTYINCERNMIWN